MTTWDSNNKLTRDTELFEAIGKIRNESDKRREVEARVLAENNLASVRQLSEDKKKQFCAIVDAILAETADVNTQLFSDPTELTEAAAKVKMTPWTKQDHNPEKNSTFTGAPKTNPNKGGYAGGAKAEKTKHGYTAMRRIKEEEEGLQELSKDTLERYVDSATGSAERGRLAAGYATRHAAKLRSYKGKNQQARDEYERVAKKRDGEAAVALKHRDKRLAGVKMATKKLGEESDLQELSKKTLGSYIKKASHDITVKGAATREFANRSREDRKNNNFVGARKNAELSDKTFNKSWNRRKNMAKAVDRLTKEDMDSLEEMYLDIENFILESEGYDSIDRLNEQGQEKLAAIVENVMEEILSEEEEYDEDLDEETDLQEISSQLLGRAANAAHGKGNILSYTKGSKDPEVRARWGQSIKFAAAARSKEAAATSKSIPSYRNLKDKLGRGEKVKVKYEENMGEESDNLQELSRKTLASYIPKANRSGLAAAANAEHSYMRGKKDAMNKYNRIGEKREIGVERAARKLAKEETVEEGWFSGKKTPTPNPKGAPRGERDVGDYKNPTGHSNKSVSQAVRNDRKLAKKNNGRLSGEGY